MGGKASACVLGTECLGLSVCWFALGGYASASDTPWVDLKVAAPVTFNPSVDARPLPLVIPTQELRCADAFNDAFFLEL